MRTKTLRKTKKYNCDSGFYSDFTLNLSVISKTMNINRRRETTKIMNCKIYYAAVIVAFIISLLRHIPHAFKTCLYFNYYHEV